MIEAPDFHPSAERQKLVVPETGRIFSPRLTTTDEQLHEAKRYLEAAALAGGEKSARCTVHWTRYEPWTVEVHGEVEHLTLPTGVEEIFATYRVVQRTADGHEIPRNEAARLARLKAELAAMREHAAGPTE
jgi:DMSO/TMAO reductase YedYZ molybdopterin-dependent catalytic subunit